MCSIKCQCHYCILHLFLNIKPSAAEPCVYRLPARHMWPRSCRRITANVTFYGLGESGTRVVHSRCGAYAADHMSGESGFTSWQGQRFICPAQRRKWLWVRPSLWSVGIQRLGHGIVRLPPFYAEVRNSWISAFTPPHIFSSLHRDYVTILTSPLSLCIEVFTNSGSALRRLGFCEKS